MLGKMTVKGDGEIVEVKDGKVLPIAAGMDDPAGLTVRDDELFCADKTKIWRIDRAGKASVYLDADAFPIKPKSLNDITTGPNGDLFTSDSGNFTSAGAVFRITPDKGGDRRHQSSHRRRTESPQWLDLRRRAIICC